jgi:hypothetical protein
MNDESLDYKSICAQTGKLYLESAHEINKLTNMLIELQQKYTAECAKATEREAIIADLSRRLSQHASPQEGTHTV